MNFKAHGFIVPGWRSVTFSPPTLTFFHAKKVNQEIRLLRSFNIIWQILVTTKKWMTKITIIQFGQGSTYKPLLVNRYIICHMTHDSYVSILVYRGRIITSSSLMTSQWIIMDDYKMEFNQLLAFVNIWKLQFIILLWFLSFRFMLSSVFVTILLNSQIPKILIQLIYNKKNRRLY